MPKLKIDSLKSNKEFQTLQNSGKKYTNKYFIIIKSLKFAEQLSKPKDVLYFGLKVSKKFSLKAVIRNKAKRRIRHLVRNLAKSYSETSANYPSFIIIPKQGMNQVEFARLNASFQQITNYN